jgi:hypothetical protein
VTISILGGGGGSADTQVGFCKFNQLTNNVDVQILSGALGGAISGLAVTVYKGTNGTTYPTTVGSGTTDATGKVSIAAGAQSTTAFFKADVTFAGLSSYLTAFLPAYSPATTTGASALRWTAGLRPTADKPAGTIQFTGGAAVAAPTITNVGAHMSPGTWQILTVSSSGTNGYRAEMQVKADGTLDTTTYRDTGVANADGTTLSKGAGVANSTLTLIISERTEYALCIFRTKPQSSPANGNGVFLGSANAQSQFLTAGGVKWRQDFGANGQLARIAMNSAINSSLTQTTTFAVDLKATGALKTACTLDGADNKATTGTTVGTAAIDLLALAGYTFGASNAGTPALYWAGQIEFFWLGVGLDALDKIANTGTYPDFGNSTVYSRLLAGNIGANGEGVTGNVPWLYMTGSSLKTGTPNLGRGPQPTTTFGAFT